MTVPDGPVRVLIADDHPIVREGLRSLLEDSDGFCVVAEARDGDEAVRLAAQHRPDVVLMDLSMPGVDGVEATRRVLADGTAEAVLVLTMHDDDSGVFAAMRAGARGYLLKGSPGSEILESLRIIASGRAIFHESVAGRLDRYFTRGRAAESSSAFPQLSSRELDVLVLVARGRSNDEISAELVLSKKTVQNYVSAILTKLAVPTRAAAVARARDAGLS